MSGGSQNLSYDVRLLHLSVIITSAEGAWLCDRSVCHSFCYSVNWTTDECGNGCRPYLADMGKGWLSVSALDSALLLHFLHHCGIADFWACVCIYHAIHSRFVSYLAKSLMPTI